MSDTGSRFVWYELMTTDKSAAEAFYEKVVGWQARDSGFGDGDYTILSMGEMMVAGVMVLPDEARERGALPGWIGYVGVPDVDAAAAHVAAAGGAVHRPPADMPEVGRFAVVADPHGAPFVLFRSASEPPGPRMAPDAPGTIGWRELHAGERESAFAFYAEVFGWTKADAVDMGAMGIYQMFATGGPPVGGMMTKTDATPRPFWLYYFNVDAIEPAVERVKQSGGQILNGPMPVPGGSWIVHALDPQGILFALVAPPKAN
jgi:predicted enzyme related to lactoylglutathione lyase